MSKKDYLIWILAAAVVLLLIVTLVSVRQAIALSECRNALDHAENLFRLAAQGFDEIGRFDSASANQTADAVRVAGAEYREAAASCR